MSDKKDISALHRLEFYKKQKAWSFSRQNIAANMQDKTQLACKNYHATTRQTNDTPIDTVRTRKPKGLNRNCVTNQFQTTIKEPTREKQTRLTCVFQHVMRLNQKQSTDVADGGVPSDFAAELSNQNSDLCDNKDSSVFSKEGDHSDTLNKTYSIPDIPTSDAIIQSVTFFSRPYVLDNNNNTNPFFKTPGSKEVEMLDDVPFEESNLTSDDEYGGNTDEVNVSTCVSSSFMMKNSKMDANINTSVSENGFMDGISKTAHSSELDLANYDLAEEIDGFAGEQMGPYDIDVAGFPTFDNQPQQLISVPNQYAAVNHEGMSYAELITEISREHTQIMHHVERKRSLMRAVCRKVIVDREYVGIRSSGDVMLSDIAGLPRGRGRIRNTAPRPGFVRNCSAGIGRGFQRKLRE